MCVACKPRRSARRTGVITAGATAIRRSQCCTTASTVVLQVLLLLLQWRAYELGATCNYIPPGSHALRAPLVLRLSRRDILKGLSAQIRDIVPREEKNSKFFVRVSPNNKYANNAYSIVQMSGFVAVKTKRLTRIRTVQLAVELVVRRCTAVMKSRFQFPWLTCCVV